MDRQRLNLLAEIHELEELLTLVPKDSLIEKVSLKSRLEKVKEDLELLQDAECSSHEIENNNELEDVVCAINNLTKEVRGSIKELTIYLNEQMNEVKETCKICSRKIDRIANKMEEQEKSINDCDRMVKKQGEQILRFKDGLGNRDRVKMRGYNRGFRSLQDSIDDPKIEEL